MVKYMCENCKKEFDKKYNYEQHINNQNGCKSTGSKRNKKEYKCPHCKGGYSRKDSLKRHLKICKKKIIKTKINKSIKNKAKITGDNNVANLNNFIKSPIYINLVIYAKDGVKHLTYDEIKGLLSSKNNLIEELTRTVNLNPSKPEHHNVFYGDMKSSYGEVYEGDTWVRKKIDEILETLIDAKIEDLNEILNDMGDFLNKKTRENIKETIEHMDYKKPGAQKN